MGLMEKINRRAQRYRYKGKMLASWVSYRTGQLHPWTYPDRMYLESTNACNLSCIMCPTGLRLMERPKGMMDYDLFTRIVDEMAPHVSTTTLHIWGEPLLHPRIYDMMRYCRERGLHAEISTNATRLDEEASRKILDAGLGAIYLCLDGVKPETYERIRRAADFERTRTNIERFVRMRHEYGDGPRVNVQIIEFKPTMEEVAEFVRTWSIPGVDRVHVKAFDSWGNQVSKISELRAGGLEDLPPRYHCPNLWYHVHIYWDGTLVCCDRDFDAKYPLGNVKDGVMRAWRDGERMVGLRHKHLTGDLDDVPSCRGCVEWAWWRPKPFAAHGNAPQR
ncbi:MAG: radical SAM protein [Chloroflexi bacterium]|nr:radical SAM protein [Chloroflexota bacterium]